MRSPRPLLLAIACLFVALGINAQCVPPPEPDTAYLCHVSAAGETIVRVVVPNEDVEERRGHYGDFFPDSTHQGTIYDCDCVSVLDVPSGDPRHVTSCDCPVQYGCAAICHFEPLVDRLVRLEPTRSEALEYFSEFDGDFCAGNFFNGTFYDCFCQETTPPPPPPCDLDEDICLDPDIQLLPGNVTVETVCCAVSDEIAQVCSAGNNAESVLAGAIECNSTVYSPPPPPCSPTPQPPPPPDQIVDECTLRSCGGTCPADGEYGLLVLLGITTGVTTALSVTFSPWSHFRA